MLVVAFAAVMLGGFYTKDQVGREVHVPASAILTLANTPLLAHT